MLLNIILLVKRNKICRIAARQDVQDELINWGTGVSPVSCKSCRAAILHILFLFHILKILLICGSHG